MFCTRCLEDRLDEGLGVDVGTISTALQVAFPLQAFNISLFNKIFGGMFAKATKMESCLKWWSDSNLRSIAGGRVVPISLEDIYRQYPQYRSLFSVLQTNVGGDFLGLKHLIDVGSRMYKMQSHFVRFARQANSEMDLFVAQCAAQHRDETGVPFTQEQIAPIWESLREQARQMEYNETMDEVYRRLNSYIGQAEAARQRGMVYQQALKVGKTEVSPVKATFKYTPSGVPLAVLGEVGCCGRFVR